MSNQQTPNVVRLRPGIVIVVVAVLALIVGLIIFNLSTTMKKMHTNNAQETQKIDSFASETDTSWYQHETIKNPVIVAENYKKMVGVANEEVPAPVERIAQPEPMNLVNKDLIDAMKAPITSNQLSEQREEANKMSNNHFSNSDSSFSLPPQQRQDPNLQADKLAFVSQNNKADDDYLHSMLKDPISKYELQAGTIIPGILITGINSDLPGEIDGQVKSNVYDSISGKYLLIPQGAKIRGIYDSKIAYGQERVLVVWTRIIYPNGQSLNLEGMEGIDMSGYAGFHDQVNNHYTKLLGSVVLMSVLASGAQLSQPQQSNNPLAAPTVGQTLAQSLGTNIANVGTTVISKSLNIQPTLEIGQAYEFNISVKKDIVFLKPYDSAS